MTPISWHVRMAAALDPMNRGSAGAKPRTGGRCRPDEPQARGRKSASRQQWQIICADVRRRAGWRCEVCGRRSRLDVHHVDKRSRGGSDFDLDCLVALPSLLCADRSRSPRARRRFARLPFMSRSIQRRVNLLSPLEMVSRLCRSDDRIASSRVCPDWVAGAVDPGRELLVRGIHIFTTVHIAIL